MIGKQTDRLFYRSRFNNFSMWLLATFVGVLYPVRQLVKGVQHETYLHGGRPVIVAMWTLVMVMFLPAAIRSPMWGIVVAPTTIKVRNIVRTHTVRWDEVERFETGRYDPWPYVGIVLLKSGRRIPITAVQSAYPWSPVSKFTKSVIPILNQHLDVSRSQTVGPSVSAAR